MKKILMIMMIIAVAQSTFAQHNWNAIVIDEVSKLPLVGVTVSIKGIAINAKSDEKGMVSLKQIPSGKHIINLRLVGYQEQQFTYTFPLSKIDTLHISLRAIAEELETIVIASTRSSRSIQDIPTRVEFIAGEELEEKANMKPGDIRMILSESTGVQTQQTSATSGNAAIRIQGLDGRYTQLLKDGFPLYAGAASGLGLLQTAPLDLKQIEMIKGSASTLYGGGAIAGLINLISKTPNLEPTLNFHFDGTDALGLTLNGFYSKRNEKIGTTVFAAYQHNSAYDPAGIDLSAIPKSKKIIINPKIFIYPSEQTTITFGLNTTLEDRIGGDLHYIEGDESPMHSYFERNKTERLNTQFSFKHNLQNGRHLELKNSLSYFNRNLQTPGYLFNGTQYSTFSEVNYSKSLERLEWIIGMNLWSDNFKENVPNGIARDYQHLTFGAFFQNVWKANSWLNIESGLRADHVVNFGAVVLPRISILFKINEKLSTRLAGGAGYKTPTIFTEETERLQYRNILPIESGVHELEKSYGSNVDLNYKTTFFNQHISFSINQLFFVTQIRNPLQLRSFGVDQYRFITNSKSLESRGAETNIKLGYEDFKLFLGYTFTDAHEYRGNVRIESPLTAKHRINAVLMYEVEEKWKVGLESYTFSRQQLNDGSFGKSYVIMGFMAEKRWKPFSIYINFENFLDARQSKFDQIYTGSITNPQFKDIYAPLDGFVINGGIKFSF